MKPLALKRIEETGRKTIGKVMKEIDQDRRLVLYQERYTKSKPVQDTALVPVEEPMAGEIVDEDEALVWFENALPRSVNTRRPPTDNGIDFDWD